MKKILMYDKYDETYRKVIDVKELVKYIQDLIIKVKNEPVEGIITEEHLKGSIINILNKTIEKLEVEDD